MNRNRLFIVAVILLSLALFSKCRKEESSSNRVNSKATSENKSPSKPMEPFPADSSRNVLPTISSISWSASSDPECDPITYDIYFGTNYPPTLVKTGNSTTSYSLPDFLKAYTIYFWQVIANDGKGNKTKSSIWNFQTGNSGGKLEPIVFNANLTYGTMKDTRDNKTYKTIVIGTQIWMAQNLNYTTSSGSWCYNDDENNCKIYGRLYTWKAAMQGAESSDAVPSGVKGICPTGWHLPSKNEWTKLEKNLNDYSSGGNLKEADTTHWFSPNLNADNSSGFTALPAGYRYSKMNYQNQGYRAYFKSTSIWDNNNTYGILLNNMSEDFEYIPLYNDYGHSVRCLKD